MADSNLNIGVSLTGAQATASGLNQVAAATTNVVAATKQAATVTTAANKATQQTATASSQGAMGLLFLSQAIEDVQYGFGAVLNNIPLIIMSMGGSAGLAGAASIAAVGVYNVAKNVDLFGTAAKAATEKAKSLAEQTNKAAAAARQQADFSDTAAESLQKYERSLDAINAAYEKEIKNINDSISAKKREIEVQDELAQAKEDAAMAEVEFQSSKGEISEIEAEQRKERIRADFARQSAARRQEQIKLEQEEARKNADAILNLAQAEDAKRKDLRDKSRGLLSDDRRRQLEEEEKNLRARIAAVQTQAAGENTIQAAATLAKAKPDIERAGQVQNLLEDDRSARRQVGDRNLDQVQKQLADKEKEIADLRQKALDEYKRVDELKRAALQAEAILAEKERAAALRSLSRIQRLEASGSAALAEQGQNLLQFARGAFEKDSTGGMIVAGQKPRVNRNELDASVRDLAGQAARAGADGYSEAELNALLKQTSESMRRLVNVNHATKKFMEDLNEKIQEMLATQNNNRR